MTAHDRRTHRRSSTADARRTALGRLSTLALVALVVALTVATWGVVGGQWRAHSVLSGSMEPRLPVGSVAITERVPTSSLRVGDVITFREPDDPTHLITHRIASISTADGRTRYETRGDANDFKDPWTVTLRGRSSYRVLADVPYLGYVVTAVRHRAVRPWLIGAAAFLVLASLVNLLLPDRLVHHRRPAAPSPAAPSSEEAGETAPAKEMAR